MKLKTLLFEKQTTTKLTFLFVFFSFFFANAQVTTNSGSGLDPAYTDLATAINALNGATITAPVVITLTGNETAPAGGYEITAQGDATNTIIIQGITSTITASNALVAGSVTDALFKLVGADYVTLQNFLMEENPANTIGSSAGANNMTEWGVALLYATTTNGAQNNTIQGNTISLVRTYPNTFGIYSNVNHSPTVATVLATITAATGANNDNKVFGNVISNVNMGISFIGSNDATLQDTNNDIGGNSAATGNTITNWGGFAAFTDFVSNNASSYCIFVLHQKAYNVSYNTLTSAAVSGTSVTFRGIFQNYTTASVGAFTNTISNNQISMISGFASGIFQHIVTAGIVNSAMTLNIINNTFLNSAVTGNSAMVGYSNTQIVNTLNVTGNIIKGWISAATTTGFSGFTSTANIPGTINISNNKIGLGSTPAITFSAATTGVITGISNTGATNTATVLINDNDIRGIVQNVSGTNLHNYITGTGTPLNLSINNNTFTNITANTSNSVTFINASANRPANSVCNVNNNSIVTAFSKSVSGGSITFYNSSIPFIPSSAIENNTGNNFSNISVTGTTTIQGWINNGGSNSTPFGPTKTITNNTFSNITTGTGTVTLLTVQSGNATSNSVVSNNTISNITSGGNLTGILSAGGKQEFSNNSITNLTGVAVRGISITGGIQNLIKNKIAGLQGNTAAGLVYGIGITNITGTSNIENNYIGNLSAPNATNALDNIRGMSIAAFTANTTFNVYHNTIYLNAASTGADFGTIGIFHNSVATATTSKLDLRNNNIVNNSTANGTGRAVAYRRSSVDLTNFAATSSNNNLFAPIIFADGTNFDATLAAYKARVTPRDASSASVAPNFLSTTTSNAGFLHIDPSIPTVLESNASVIAVLTTDFDNDIRQGAVGYSGTGTAPDIGADEFEGITTCSLEPIISNSLVVYALGATATPLTATGTNLLWYTSATGGTGSAIAPTPSTAAYGTTSYWVTQTGAGCESPRVKIDVLIDFPATHLNFDGIDDTITFPRLISSDFTIEYWMKTTQVGSAGTQWYNGNGIIDAEVGGVTTDFGTSLTGNQLAFGIGSPDVTIFSTSNVNTGNWVHVAVTWEQATGAMKLYINGILESSATGGTALRSANANIKMGSLLVGGQFYNGSIDEVRIWNNALSADALVRRKNCELIGSEPGLVTYYKFNQGLAAANNTGVTTLTDSSPTGNSAALSNFALTGSTSNWLDGSVVTTGSLIPLAPTAAPQTVCINATVADLVATGTNLLWYNTATGGTSLASNTVLVAGTYYVSSYNLNGCESTRTSVAVTLGNATTWNGTIWDNGTPISTSSVIISGNYSEAINLSACSLLVNNNAVVLVPTGYNFNISGAVTVDPSASLTFDNNSNLIQVNNVANTGNITVKRSSASLMRQDYILWSSPVIGQQLLAFSPATLTNRFYTYNPSTNLYVVETATNNFATGTGYLIRMPNNHPTTPTIWNGTFTGTPNNGDVNLTVANATFNAVGNPYPSAIDANLFISANNITEALYFWRKTNNSATTSYATYTTAGGVSNSGNDPLNLAPNRYMRVGQGFIAKSTGTTLSFTNAMRSSDITNVFLRTSTVERNRIWLNLTNTAGFFSQTMVAYMTDATQGIDAAIDGRFFNDSQTALTSVINTEEFAIQGRALPFAASDIVPLGFKSELAGNYSIGIDHVDGLFTGNQIVYLKDNLINMTHNLSTGNYTFATAAGVFNTRFEIVYQNILSVDLPTFNENSVVVYKANGEIHINAGVTIMDNVKIFDISGRLLAEKSKVNASETTLDCSKFGTQVLIVQITSDTQIKVSKKVVN